MQLEETVLTFKIDGVTGSGESYIDLARCMSMVNRKLYRQQGLWQVLGVQLYADALDSNVAPPQRIGVPYTVSISGAPRTWVTRNALVKMFHLWIEQQRHAQDALDTDIRPGWEDFKVYLNENHRTTTEEFPVSGHMFGNDDPYDVGEWVHSKIVFEEVVAGAVVEHEPELHILGADNGNTNKGVITQYARSRAIVHSPDPVLFGDIEDTLYAVATDPLADQMQEIVENMKTDNDEPPYSANTYPGGGSNGIEPLLFGFVANTSGATKGRKTVMNGFAAPNGLLEIQRHINLENTTEGQADYTVPELWLQVVIGQRSDY